MDDANQYIVKEDLLRLYEDTRPLLEFAPSSTIEAERAAAEEQVTQDEADQDEANQDERPRRRR